MMGTKKGYCGDCSSYDRLAQVGDSDHWVCEECYPAYHKCHNCEEMKVHEDSGVKDTEGHWICEDCQEEVYKCCDSCSEIYHENDDRIKQDDNQDWYCDPCVEEGCGTWEEHHRAIAGDEAYDRWRDENIS